MELHVPDASRDQIGEHSVVADLASIDFDLMNPSPARVRPWSAAGRRARDRGARGTHADMGMDGDRAGVRAPRRGLPRALAADLANRERARAFRRPFRTALPSVPGNDRRRAGDPGAALGHPTLAVRREHRRPPSHRRGHPLPAGRRRRRAVLRRRRSCRAGGRGGLRERDRDRDGDRASPRRAAGPAGRRAAAPRAGARACGRGSRPRHNRSRG